MRISNQDALEKEYRELVFVDVYWTDFSEEGIGTWKKLHTRMDEIRTLIDGPVQQTVDVEFEVLEPNRLTP